MKRFRFLLPLAIAAAGACSDSPTTPSTSSAPYSQTDLVVGSGAQAATSSRVTVNYTGWLYEAGRTDAKGTQFDSQNGFAFVLGSGQVIKGWDQGVPGMRVGGQRRLVIPPDLAYGSAGRGTIPPNATLLFDITLVGVQ